MASNIYNVAALSYQTRIFDQNKQMLSMSYECLLKTNV